ncbi:MAG: Hsp70 family protein [Chlamydiales bacterium]|nr:Hsp70 family protein [Chlamydiales bacterium]
MNAQYLIGIDLGTTNCTMAAASISSGLIETLPITQLTTFGEQNLTSLPSFIYFALPEEISSGLPEHCLGTFARERGAEVPGRVIASAKSWLCHAGVDRRQRILPSDAEENSPKLSPIEACTSLLSHLRNEWNTKHPEAPFDQQQIYVTVPASFDPSARQLVQEAALEADYPDLVLLEEPQAAFYAWLQSHEETWRKQLQVGDTILVVDIGGGTTDFSLIKVEEEAGEIALRRLAVGAHLLLGGDNLDLALAYVAKAKLEEQGHDLDIWQMQSLVHRCREAKESFLGDTPPEQLDISIRGRSSRLVGGTITTSLSREEAEQVLVEGFFPLVEPTERSSTERRLGIQQVGLPYAQDPRVSCQLAKFLSMTGETDSATMNQFVVPTAVLFNGGTLKSVSLRERIVELLNLWAASLGHKPVTVLADADYDFAVSRGAVNYGLARNGKSIRIRGGTSRSYYIGVEDAVPAVPGVPTPLKAVCVVPFGMEEGTEQTLEGQEFALLLGQPATFRFFSRSTPDQKAEVRNWKRELTELHPIETVLDRSDSDGRTIRVTLRSKVTELGVLELWCVAADGRQWKLEFDVRQSQPEDVLQG